MPKAAKAARQPHEVGEDSAEPCREPLAGEGYAHEDAHGTGAVSRPHHVTHKGLRDRDDARRKTAGNDASSNEKRQVGDHRAEKRSRAKPEHDDTQEAQTPHTVAQTPTHRLQGTVGQKIGREHDGCSRRPPPPRVCAIEGSAGETNQLSAAETRPQKPSVTTTCNCAGVSRASSFSAIPIASAAICYQPNYRQQARAIWKMNGYSRALRG